jgi:hypothetical protein
MLEHAIKPLVEGGKIVGQYGYDVAEDGKLTEDLKLWMPDQRPQGVRADVAVQTENVSEVPTPNSDQPTRGAAQLVFDATRLQAE